MMKILAIDDNQDNLISLKALINESFHEVSLFSTTSGTIGIELAKTEDPDVILLDIVMPGMDGFEVCRKLKANPILRDIPVVFLTALKGDKESRIRALECGGEAFLAKPIDETELTAQIKAMVKIKQANLEKRDEKERLEALVQERTRQLQQELEERKSTEKALRESEERFQMLFNEAPLGYQSLDDKGYFIEVNKQWLNTLGYAREEVIGKWFGDFLSPEYQDGFRKRFPIFKAQGFIHSEFEMIHKNGEKLFIAFEGRIGYDPKGNFKQTHCILQDITQSKKAIDALKESEERFKHIFEAANVGKSITMPTGEINVNQAFCDMLGYTKEELQNKKWQDITPAEDIDFTHEIVNSLLKGEKNTARFNKRYLQKNGNSIWTDVSVVIIRDQHGKPLHFITTIIDINDQVKAENALLESEEITRTLLNGLPESTILIELDGTVITANNTVAQRLGKTVDELIGKNIYQTVMPEVAERRRKFANHVIETKKSFQFEDERFGKIIDNRIHPVFDPQGNVIQFAIIGIDITDRKMAEVRIRESEMRSRSTFDQSPVGSVIVGLDKRFIKCNAAFCRFLGYTEDELIGKTIAEITHTEDIELGMLDLKLMIEGEKESSTLQKRYLRKDGTIVWGEVSISLVRDADNKPMYFLPVIQDITGRKSTEEKLQINEERLRNALEAATDAIWDWNVTTSEMYFSPRWYEILGYHPNEIKLNSKEWVALAHPDDKDAALKTIYESIGNGLPYEIEFRTKHADGHWVWCLVKGKVTGYDASGKPTRVSGTNSDVTLRKQTEEALRESEVQYRNLADSGAALIWTSGTDKLCNYFNEPWLRFTGRTLEQELGNGWTEGVHPEDYDRCVQTYTWAFDRCESFEMEYRLRHASGEYRWLRDMGTPNYDSHGEFIGYIGHCFDITERKQIETELVWAKEKAETSEQFLKIKNEELLARNTFIQTILENLSIGVALNEIDSGVVTYMNKKFQEIYGWSSDELTSVDLFFEKVFTDEAYRKHLIERIMDDIQSGEESRMHWENLVVSHKDGRQRIVNTVNIPLIEQNTMVSTVMDITDLHNIQEDLIAAKEKAEESDRLKTAFLANMSHEIRTPMNSIMGFASLLPEEDSFDLIANYAKIIVRSSEQLVHIIDDIVLYSRLQTKLLSYSPTPFNVHNLLTDVKQSFSLPEFQKGIELSIETTSDIPIWVSSDYEKLRQIFTNLISNAFKYTFSGSITIGFVQKENELEFFVRDTGLGIPPNEVENVFERFFRGSNVNKGVIGGTGLGLSIVKELTELLGGKIWVESEEGKGSTFSFTLPKNM